MKTFPKCQALQRVACRALLNLTCCSCSKAKAIESDGIEGLLAAINNHLSSSDICENACWALLNVLQRSKENIGLLINLGGGAAVDKVRTKWPDNDNVQIKVRFLAKDFAAEWKALANEDEK
jgi:hypothetical protein